MQLLGQNREMSGTMGDVRLRVGFPGGDPEASVQLSSLKGKPCILLILGVNCKTCKHLAALLSKIDRNHASQAHFFGVCLQSGCSENLAAFASGGEIEIPLTSSTLRELSPALSIPPSTWLFYPTLVIIDSEQRSRDLFIAGDPFFQDVEDNLLRVLGKLVPAASSNDELEVAR